ncbi:isochorismatase family protein [Chitinimonas sp.]|uniref:isochorismatase family protein n=1 Tax=Chitinimonas sp. TaxID=1934313 RepID=UPI0035B114CD
MTIPKIAPYAMPQTMPARRLDWQPHPQRAALLIHDMQDYFLDFFDGAAEPITSLLAHIGQLRAACDAAGIPVYYTAQPAVQNAAERGLLQDWWGSGITARPERAGIVAPLAPRAHDTVLDKWRYSAFVRSDFAAQLQAAGRDQLIICGVYAHIGCLMTAADAFMRDIQPFFAGNALADFSAEQHAMALDYVAGRCGMVMASADLIAAIQAASASLPASQAALVAEVACLLQLSPSEMQPDDNLLYLGLDSMRLMTLATRWRAAGASVSFAQLGEQPTLAHWWALLSQGRGG